METLRKHWAIWSIAIIVLLGLLVSLDGTVFLYTLSHALINIFAGGRSDSKVIAFAVFLVLAFGATLFWNKRLPIWRWHKIGLIGTILAAYALNLASFFYFTNKLGFRLGDFIITISGGELSTTRLIHNHTLKGSAAIILDLLGHPLVQENIDTGLVFLNLIPSWVLILNLALALLIALGYFYFLAANPVKKRPIIQIVYVLLFSIVTFSLLKNLFDGGLLNVETPVSLALLALLLYPKQKLSKIVAPAIILLYIALLLIFYYAGFFEDWSSFTFKIYQVVGYAVTGFSLWYLIMLNKFNRLAVLLLILSGLLLWTPVINDLKILEYRQQQITTDDKAIIGTYQELTGTEYKLIENVGKLKFYEYQPQTTDSIANILTRLELLDNFYPVMVEWKTCMPRSNPRVIDFELASPQQLHSKPEFSYNVMITKFEYLGQHQGLHRYNITLTINPCYPRQLNIMQEAMQAAGLTDFYILNPKQNDGAVIPNPTVPNSLPSH